jgi:L-fucose dehydrogenase
MNLELRDKVFVITGGASGIGAGISRALVKEGATPIMVGRNEAKGEALLKELGHGRHITQQLGSPESCRMVVEEVLKITDRVDGLINNAGANDGVGLEKGTPERFLDSLQSNLHHYYFLAHYLLEPLKKKPG